MFDLLEEYAALHHQLPLPGIVLINLEHTPSKADFSEKLFYPPKQEWKLLPAEEVREEPLVNYIARKQNVSTVVAGQQLQDFCHNLQHQLNMEAEIKFPGVGILKQETGGSLQLETIVELNMLLKPVMAERVIRKDATHTMLVGDREQTSVQMNEILNSLGEEHNNRWWAWAAAAFVFALGMIIYSYSNNNWTIKASGNQQTITPKSAPAEVSSSFK